MILFNKRTGWRFAPAGFVFLPAGFDAFLLTMRNICCIIIVNVKSFFAVWYIIK